MSSSSKYLADNDFAALTGEALQDAIKEQIKKKDGSLVGNMAAQGTTPRRLTDLIGSLCDLTSGSGDKGHPIVYIQGISTTTPPSNAQKEAIRTDGLLLYSYATPYTQ